MEDNHLANYILTVPGSGDKVIRARWRVVGQVSGTTYLTRTWEYLVEAGSGSG